MGTDGSGQGQKVLPKDFDYYNILGSAQTPKVKSYASKLSFPTDDPYYVLITSYDVYGNEKGIDDGNYFQVIPKDNIPPATMPLDGFTFEVLPSEPSGKIAINWGTPAKNVDGSPFDAADLSPDKGYVVYFGVDMKADNFFSSQKIEIPSSQHTIEIPIDDFKKNWCFYVVPQDKEGNMQFGKDTMQLMDNPSFFSPTCILHN